MPEVREKLIIFLRANTDIFAWTAIDMPGIPNEVIVHKLSIDLHYPLLGKRNKTLHQKGRRPLKVGRQAIEGKLH